MFILFEKNDICLLKIIFFRFVWEFFIIDIFWLFDFSCCEKFELLYLVGNICKWIICCFIFCDDVFSLVK